MTNLFFDEQELLEMYKLKNITRYNHKTRLKDESVAEHSFFTTLIALELCKKLKLDEKTTFLCVVKALLHDLPETELNDITYDVKLALNLYPLLKVYEDKYFDKHFHDFADLMNNDDENVVNLVIKYSDAASVLQYAYNEISLGNTKFAEIKDETIERLNVIYKKLMEAIRNEKN